MCTLLVLDAPPMAFIGAARAPTWNINYAQELSDHGVLASVGWVTCSTARADSFVDTFHDRADR